MGDLGLGRVSGAAGSVAAGWFAIRLANAKAVLYLAKLSAFRGDCGLVTDKRCDRRNHIHVPAMPPNFFSSCCLTLA
jgi:hypothetical protein